MRFMMIVKASPLSEAGNLPDEKSLAAMAVYNEQLVKAGVLLDGVGLQASSKGARINYSNGKVKVTDGPFAETRELVAGYWMIQVKSREEAIEWARRIPFAAAAADGEFNVELRQVFELADFAPGEAVDHHKQNEDRLRR